MVSSGLGSQPDRRPAHRQSSRGGSCRDDVPGAGEPDVDPVEPGLTANFVSGPTGSDSTMLPSLLAR